MTHQYIFLETLGSSLMKCQHKDSGAIVAIKTFRYSDHPIAKQLIRILKKCLDNDNILKYVDVFKRKKRICLVLEYVPRQLLSLLRVYPSGLPEDYVKLLMFQLFTALKDMHANNIVHRDIKPEKILLSNGDTHVKLGGFGLAKYVEEQMTPHVTTSWYRAPEIICESSYGCPIDIWAAGIVMAELLDGRPLLPGDDEIEILSLIQSVIGPLSEKQKRSLHKKKIQVPMAQTKGRYNTSSLEKRFRDKISKTGMNFLRSLLKISPTDRPTAEKCLQNTWFEGINVEKLKNRYHHEPERTEDAVPVPPYLSTSSVGTLGSQHQLNLPEPVKTKRRYPVRINGNYKVQIGSNSNHISIVFHRIPRVKATDKKSHDIPSLGTLKVHRVDDYLETVPPEWKQLGGVFVALYQSESLKISIENHISTENDEAYTSSVTLLQPKAVKLAYGNLNAKSGQAWKRDSKSLSDHYIIYPHKREFVDGVVNTNDDLHQFCCAPLQGSGGDLSNNMLSQTMQVVMYEAKLVSSLQQNTNAPLSSLSSVGNSHTYDHAKGIQGASTSPDPRNQLLPNIKTEVSPSAPQPDTRLKKRKGLAKYEILETVGEGTYGVVMKARDRETLQIVAIKKFKDSEYNDESVRKTTQREKKVLQQLSQENIVQLKEHFRRKGKMYLVFEYVPRNMLEALEEHEHGFHPDLIRVYMYQILKALDYCHEAGIIHRDVKLENLLIHHDHTLKLCDFGFARTLSTNGTQTPYVSTRWYRAPELLVNAEYGKPVDIWAVGCIMGEITDGKPLFPGTTDLDQLYLIQNIEGEVPSQHIEAFHKKYKNYKFPKRSGKTLDVQERYGGKLDDNAIDFMRCLLKLDPNERWTASELLRHPYFDGFNIDELFSSQNQTHGEDSQQLKLTGDPKELPKLLTSWNQGGGITPETIQQNLSMKPPLIPPKGHSVSPSESPPKREIAQISLPTTIQQKTPRRVEKPNVKAAKQEPVLKANRRASQGTYDDLTSTISITKPQSRSSSRQSSRQSIRAGNRSKQKPSKETKDTRPPLPLPTSDRSRNAQQIQQPTQKSQPKQEIQIEFGKFGRFYLHIVNSEQYKMITGFPPEHESIEKSVYDQLSIPWYDEYNEQSLPTHDSLSHIGFIQPKKSFV